MTAVCLLLAALSVWDYPERQPQQDQLRRELVVAIRAGRAKEMEETCRKGVRLLPDDATWHYNLACSLARLPRRHDEALDELERAIDLGFRDADRIAADTDLKGLETNPRHGELIAYAREISTKPLVTGPLAAVPATGFFGETVALGAHNLGWDLDTGCYVAKMSLTEKSAGGNVGDLYMNRDAQHSAVAVTNYPGLTAVRLDREGRERKQDLNRPNILFPYPVFGNSSMAFTVGPYWRSIPRALMTIETPHLREMQRFYLSNQTWVFPSNADTAPVGTNGDVFASITPYWMTTAGRSWSDLPYVDAALRASAAFRPGTKRELVRRGLLAPTIQTLIRKSLTGVGTEADYLSPKAHPTAFPPKGVDLGRLTASARALAPEAIPPLAAISVTAVPAGVPAKVPELTYATAFAWAYVLRAPAPTRVFHVRAIGAGEYRFVLTHGPVGAAQVEQTSADTARVTVRTDRLSPTQRVDVAVFGRNAGTDWGAPSYVSFARMDSTAPYSDPALTPPAESVAK